MGADEAIVPSPSGPFEKGSQASRLLTRPDRQKGRSEREQRYKAQHLFRLVNTWTPQAPSMSEVRPQTGKELRRNASEAKERASGGDGRGDERGPKEKRPSALLGSLHRDRPRRPASSSKVAGVRAGTFVAYGSLPDPESSALDVLGLFALHLGETTQ